MKNKSKINCMHIAARRGNLNIAMRIMEVAMKEGDDMNLFVNSKSQLQKTPLYIAAKFGNFNIIKLLLDK